MTQETHLNLVADVGAGAATEPLLGPLIAFLYDMREQVPIFVVYDHPTDFPDHVVARLWITKPERPIHLVLRASAVEPLRDFLDACGLVHLSRSPDDDPTILETWI